MFDHAILFFTFVTALGSGLMGGVFCILDGGHARARRASARTGRGALIDRAAVP